MEAVQTPAPEPAAPDLTDGGYAVGLGLTRVLESMSLAFCALDREWRYTYVNARAEQVLGMSREDLLGGVFWDLFPSAVGTPFETHYREAMDTRRAVTFRAHYPAPLDAWYELTADGSDEGLAVYFADITDRVSAQEAAELSGRRLGAVGEVALALAGIQDITDLVTTIAEQGLRALGADGGSVAIPDPQDPAVLLSYLTTSYGPGSQADYGRLTVATDLPACQAYRTGAPVLLSDREASVAHSPLMEAVIASTGSTAWASVPLSAGGRVLGALTAGWGDPQPFDAEQLDLLSTFASQCAQALERISGRDAERAAAEAARTSAGQQAALVAVARALGEADSEGEVLAVVATRGLELLNASVSGLCLPDGDGVRVVTTDHVPGDLRAQWQHLPADTPLPFVQAAVGGPAVYISDVEQALRLFPAAVDIVSALHLQAQASVPLRARGRLLGSLNMGFPHVRDWPDAEVGLVEAFAALTAQALDRIYARDAEQAATVQQATLVALASALGQAQSEADVFAVVAARSIGLLGAFGSGVCLREPDGTGVRTLATETISSTVRESLQHLPADYSMPIVDTAMSGTAHFLVDRAEAAARFSAAQEHYTAGGVQASAQVPLLAQGHLLGSLSLAFAEPRAWPVADRAVVEAFAALVAQALERITSREAEHAAAIAAGESADQQAALVAAATALSAAQTEADVFTVVADKGVGMLGAFGSSLSLRQPHGAGVRTRATDTISPDLQEVLQTLPADAPLPLVHTAMTGVAHFGQDRAQTAAELPGSEAMYTALDLQASAAVPLRVRGQLVGSLSLGFHHARTWPQQDRDLVGAFAALVAQALQRIAAHDAERLANTAERAASAEVARFSETLQRSLLSEPPAPDHLQVAVRYSPAAEQALVGGDWYDAYVTSGGATSIVIGDVTGHDSRAAAAMAQYRNLLRGIGYTVGDPPALVLGALDRAVHDLGVGSLATIILAQVEQTPEQAAALDGAGLRTLRWSNAGHPPPLLISADGTASYLDSDPDLLLGLDPSARRADHTAVLAPGDSVLLFTDGLVERRGVDLRKGLDWLAGAAAELAHLPLEEMCDALLTLVGSGLDDDVAMLALRAHPEDRPRPAAAGPAHVPRDELVLTGEA